MGAATLNGDLPSINFTIKNDPFYTKCRQKLSTYFKDGNKTRLANREMYTKTVFLITVWVGLYALIISDLFIGISLIVFQICWHFNMFLMSVGIAHDGAHKAYSKKKYINKIFARTFDYIGINSDMWEYSHIKSHHNFPNVPLYDAAIFSLPIFRFHPRAPYNSMHRYQHIYLFFIYALSTLFKLFILDFLSFARFHQEAKKWAKLRSLAYLIFTKLFVLSYTLLIPFYVQSAPAWQIILGFLAGHLISGIALGIFFQVTHLHESTVWPEPDSNGNISNSFARHILQTTSDFCPDSKIITWLSGGLNLHVAHHLFPAVSQVHLIPLGRIIRETAEEYGLTYHYYPTVRKAISSHISILKKLGQSGYLSSRPSEMEPGSVFIPSLST